ncbi:MAG: GDSL-type esterase/lipase family protein [Pirellulaceae bacterium]|nr:GDSL-type esterase/lipase family protein [Pirellulaceae bacterium]
MTVRWPSSLLLAFFLGWGITCSAQEPREQRDDTALVRPLAKSPFGHPPFEDRFAVRSPDQTIVFLGGTSTVDRQTHGYLETLLSLSYADRSLRFRNLGWEADTVFRQQRPRFFYTTERFERGVKDQRPLVPADIVFLEFGQIESLDGLQRLDEFQAAYARIIEEVKARTAQVVIVSPAPFLPIGPAAQMAVRRNQVLAAYAQRIRQLAERFDCLLVDQFSEFVSVDATDAQKLSSTGIRWTSYGQWMSALYITRQLSATSRLATGFDVVQQRFDNELAEVIRREVLAKNRLWFQQFRPTNWAFLYGNRQDTESSWDIGKKNRWFPGEVEQLPEMIERAELRIRSLVVGDNSVEAEQAGFRLARHN